MEGFFEKRGWGLEAWGLGFKAIDSFYEKSSTKIFDFYLFFTQSFFYSLGERTSSSFVAKQALYSFNTPRLCFSSPEPQAPSPESL